MFRSGNGGSMDGIPALAGDRVVITTPLGGLTTSVVTSTELSYLSGVTSNVQTQLNGKQPTGNYITALTGDVTATGPGSVAATLATVNGSPGTFGSVSQTLVATVNGKGLVTALSATAIAITSAQVSGSFPFTSITGTVPILQGGTGQTTKVTGFNALSPLTTVGDVLSHDGTNSVRVASGTTGQFLGANTGGLPSWQTPLTNIYAETYFSSSGTFTTPANSNASTIYAYEIQGGGGGGGSTSGLGASGGGGGGGYARGFFTGIAASTGISIIVGGAGAGGVGSGNGSSGSASIISSPVNISCNGGSGGAGSSTSGQQINVGGTGGIVTGSPQIAIPGQNGGTGWSVTGSLVLFGGCGGNSGLGNGGPGGQAGANSQSGIASVGYGSGGGGSTGTGTGTAGQPGIIIIKRMTL